MADPRNYSRGTRAALAALSRGACYAPGCPAQIIRFVDGDPYIDYEIAHIRDAKPGNRYDPDMIDDERRAFSNLVLLCTPHHKRVDKTHPNDYSSADLQQWKVDRESAVSHELAPIGPVEPDDLEAALLQAAISIRDSTVDLGGEGGNAPGAGGGGGGVIGSGTAGRGGDGGQTIVLDGSSAAAPGAGGGGGGAIGHGAYAGEGGGGGEHVIVENIDVSDVVSLNVHVGEGGDHGDGGDSYVETVRADGTSERTVIARGGQAGRSGTSVRDHELGPSLTVSAAILADTGRIRGGLLDVLDGGLDRFRFETLPEDLTLVLALVLDPARTGPEQAELAFEVRDGDGALRCSTTAVVQFHAEVLPHRFPYVHALETRPDSPGVWNLGVNCGGKRLASLPFHVEVLAAPATDPTEPTDTASTGEPG